jgi:hypothetical protein
VAWRLTDGNAPSNDVYRWNGTTVSNLTVTPQVSETYVRAAGNGDLIWSRANTNLMYYDASANLITSLGVRGVIPTLYVTETGVTTYAWQDPNHSMYYFDGNTTHTLGMGVSYCAHPSVWAGTVAWVGPGAGVDQVNSEIYVWKDGTATRVTNDDAVNGIQDDYPVVWDDLVVWQRAPTGGLQPRLFLWDGRHTVQLLTTFGEYPSLHNGKLDYLGADGLYLADVLPPTGDCNGDGTVGPMDFAQLTICLSGPDLPPVGGCTCTNVDGDTDTDLADYAQMQRLCGL